MEIPKLSRSITNKEYVIRKYNEFYQFIIEKYDKLGLLWSEMLYWYYNNITEKPKCPICGEETNYRNITLGYNTYCCKLCSVKGTREKAKQTCLERFGKDNMCNRKKAQETMLKRYGVKNYTQTQEYIIKSKKTYLEKYGVDNFTKTPEFKEKRKKTFLEKYGVEDINNLPETKQKIKQTKLERHGDPHYNNPEKYRKTSLERYGVESYSKTKEWHERYKKTSLERYGVETYTLTQEFLDREYQTKKKNKSFNSSTPEKEFEQYLKDNNIEYKTQYKSELYPFNCDFYLPKYDLYVELNIFWHHGKRPYTGSEEDLKKLEMWKSKGKKSYNEAIKTWTIRDVEKRNIAKQNKLNYLEIFTEKRGEIIKAFSYFINEKLKQL